MYAVYRFRNRNGDLLYVGASSRLTLRLKEHQRYQPWWHEVDLTDVTTEWFYTVEEAAMREHELIQLDRPRYNSRHAGKYSPNVERRPMVARVVDDGEPFPESGLVARMASSPGPITDDDDKFPNQIDTELVARMASGE